MPATKSIRCLEGVVVGCADAVFLQDVAGIGKLRVKRMASACSSRIYVGHNVQLAALAAYVTNLEDGRMPQALLHLQAIVVKIRSAEILVDSVCRECIATAVRVCGHVERRASRHISENGARARSSVGADRNRLNRLPIVASGAANICAVVGNRMR